MLKKIKAVLIAALLATSVCTGCDGGKLEQTEYTVEYGNVFNLPKPDGEYTVAVKDGDGKDVRTQFGSFRPSVGSYKAEYDISGKKQTVTITCVDTTAPVIKFSNVKKYVAVGDTLVLPEYSITDLSEQTEPNISVTKSDGSAVTLDGANSWIAENDTYTVKVSAADVFGNLGEQSVKISARTRFVDTALAEGKLADFDENGYADIVYGVEDKTNFDCRIVHDGYPAIENETENNGVLELSTDCNYGDVYAEVTLNDASFDMLKACKCTFKVCVDRDTDYVRILAPDGSVAAESFMLKSGVWTEIEMDVLDYGYGGKFDGFILVARADKGLKLYLDEITYSENYRPALQPGELAVFDNEGYVGRMRQNLYNGSGAKSLAGGSTFAIADEGESKVMRVNVTHNNGGFTYIFDEAIDTENIQSLTVRMNVRQSCNHIWLGYFQGTYDSGTNSYGALAPWDNDHKLYVGEMKDYVLSGDGIRNSCADGKLTGIWVGVVNVMSPSNVIDIESITIQYKS